MKVAKKNHLLQPHFIDSTLQLRSSSFFFVVVGLFLLQFFMSSRTLIYFFVPQRLYCRFGLGSGAGGFRGG